MPTVHEGNQIRFPDDSRPDEIRKLWCAHCILDCLGPKEAGGSVFAEIQGKVLADEEIHQTAACLKSDNSKNKLNNA